MRNLTIFAACLGFTFPVLANTAPDIMKATAIVATIKSGLDANKSAHNPVDCMKKERSSGGFIADITVPKSDTIIATFRSNPVVAVTFTDNWLKELTPDLMDGHHFGVAYKDQSFWIVTEDAKCEAFELVPPPDVSHE